MNNGLAERFLFACACVKHCVNVGHLRSLWYLTFYCWFSQRCKSPYFSSSSLSLRVILMDLVGEFLVHLRLG